ncbi:MAG: 50S ribosomal protein L30 [Bacteroidaceae bacterium]|nr:50S ribosomal protein L30 [Prevotellaceae bacterium]MDY2850153.1 50S ribosomal protein L30 [Bacteroidaceae bacterium]
MATIKIKQIKSRIGAPKDQKRTLDSLGLRKMNAVVSHEDNPCIRGMIQKVHHLVSIVE